MPPREKAALHQYGSRLERRIERIRHATESAEALVAATPDDASALADASLRMIQERIYDVMMAADGGDLKELSAAARALAEVVRAGGQGRGVGGHGGHDPRRHRGRLMAAPRTLLPYQARWVQDAAGVKVIEKSRRVELSWAEAYDAVMHTGADRGNVYYQSYNKDMTRGFIDDCAEWARALNKGAEAVGEALIRDGGRDVQAFRLELASGREVLAMTSAPRAFRSKGRPGDVAVIDEAAFVDDLDEALKAALAFRQWGGRVRIISTHNGAASPFAAVVRDLRDRVRPGSLHTVTLARALDEGLYKRICAVTGQDWSAAAEAAWEAQLRAQYGPHAAEELDCVPSAGAGAWLAWELIRAVLWTREMVARQDISFSEQRRIVRDLAARYRPTRIAVDQTGMGEAVVEQLQDDHGRIRVEGVLMTGPRRLDVATSLREAMEDHRLRIPPDDALRRDLYSVRAEAGPTGAAR